ncbi:hypothetical protein DRP77_04335 [Candidatus Poribacteria bacterium]|nr:MAG: hypothetical protein DRP77_04335 [Candidatus Poribacteria bacterium]
MRSESLALLRERLGAEVADALIEVIEERIEKFGVTKEEHRRILSRLDGVEAKLTAIETRMGALEKRVERLEKEIDSLREEMREMRREMNDRFERLNVRIDSMIRWTIGTISLFGVIITAVMVILKLFG